MAKYRIVEISYAQKSFDVEANNLHHAKILHEKGMSQFLHQGGFFEGELVDREIKEVIL